MFGLHQTVGFPLSAPVLTWYMGAFGYPRRVTVTPAVYPGLFEFHHFDTALGRNHIAPTPSEAIAMHWAEMTLRQHLLTGGVIGFRAYRG